MGGRLLGQETEYAIRFTPSAEGRRPHHELIHRALMRAMAQRVLVRKGAHWASWLQYFTENGGAFCYEHGAIASTHGLIEGGTPECTSASQLLVYQRAQEELLIWALPHAEQYLAAHGYPGSLGLLKNSRDARGNVYGTQENYEANVAEGVALWGFRCGIAALVPLALLLAPVLRLYRAACRPLGFGLLVVFRLVLGELDAARDDGRHDRLLGHVIRVLHLGGRVMAWPVVWPFNALCRALAFRRARRALTAHLASRVVFAGAGTLHEDGRFRLSERLGSVGRIVRRGIDSDERVFFDLNSLHKLMLGPLVGESLFDLFRLFRGRQRLQLGSVDGNPAEVAELLRVGTTLLLLDLAELGHLDDAPTLESPLDAIAAFDEDPDLRAEAQLADGRRMTAVALQRWYLERATRILSRQTVTSLESRTILSLWADTLDRLERRPASLVGRVDWITKRFLIGSLPESVSFEALKKVDLKYHELRTGYFQELVSRGLAPRLAGRKMVERAVTEPPADTPAGVRTRVLKELEVPEEAVRVSWRAVRVRRAFRPRVISLERK